MKPVLHTMQDFYLTKPPPVTSHHRTEPPSRITSPGANWLLGAQNIYALGWPLTAFSVCLRSRITWDAKLTTLSEASIYSDMVFWDNCLPGLPFVTEACALEGYKLHVFVLQATGRAAGVVLQPETIQIGPKTAISCQQSCEVGIQFPKFSR